MSKEKEPLLLISMHMNQPSEASYMLCITNTSRAVFSLQIVVFVFWRKRKKNVICK